VTVAVKAGQKVDGRIFRAAYFADESFFDRMAKQPVVIEGLPEVQGLQMTK
jgi:hypothetical protein